MTNAAADGDNLKHDKLIEQLVPTLYEDDEILAIEKPAGIDTGRLPSQSQPGIVEVIGALRGGDERLEPANRLSRYESGVLLLAKTPVLAKHIRTGLKTMRIAQQYVVVVLGKTPQARMTIDPQRGSSRGKTDGRRRPAPRRPAPRRGVPGATATLATILQSIKQGPKRSLIKCTTHVSTTHALKAQLRSVKLRALGDVLRAAATRPMTHQMTCLHLVQIGFHHPGKAKKITVRAKTPDVFEAVMHGRRDVTRFLRAGLVRRLPCLTRRESNAYRLLSGNVEDVPGVTVEVYDDVVVIEVSEARAWTIDTVRDAARWYSDQLGVKAVYVRQNLRGGGGESAAHVAAAFPVGQPIAGKETPAETIVTETGMRFVVRPWDAGSVGLYLDHRDNRRRIRSMSAGKDVLNLFAYTCGFSVAAARGGASSTVSVDLAGAALEWGKKNLELNGFAADQHEFESVDAATYFRRARKEGRDFDLIIMDPPSFSHGRKRGQDFSVARDLPELVREACGLLRKGGVMMVSTNLRKMSHAGLRKHIKEGAGKRRHRIIEKPKLPGDFAIDPDHAKTMFVQFD